MNLKKGEQRMELKIEYLPIGSLKPYKNNARKHADKDLSTIIASIKEFGFDDPIGIWSDDNIIVEGHGRLLAAQKLGMKEVPCIRLDHLTDEQRRAYALAHNKTAEMSEWDLGLLDFELGEIELDMSEFGFDLGFGKDIEPFDDEVNEKSESEYTEKKEKYTVCPQCGMHFIPILTEK